MTITYSPSETATENAHIPSMNDYQTMYDKSIKSPEAFWADVAQRLDWFAPWNTVRDFDFVDGQIQWFSGGKLNASYNCLDRHIKNGHGDQTAIIWEGNDPNQSRTFTYKELLKDDSIELSTFFNTYLYLKKLYFFENNKFFVLENISQLLKSINEKRRIAFDYHGVYKKVKPVGIRLFNNI